MTSPEQLDADLDAALADDTRWPTVSVVADWDRDGHNQHPVSDLTGWASDLTIDRQAGNSDLPSTVNLVEGPIAASLSLTLAQPFDDTTDPDTGDVTAAPAGQDPAPTFAPYNQSSSLYAKQTIGTPITADLGFDTASGEQVRRRFTGRVTSIKPSASSHEVAIDALDGADQCRARITQAPVGLDSLLLATYGPYRYSPRINSQWLVDRVLRGNGWYASPPPQPGSFISATMHGSQVPEIGAGGIPQQTSAATPSAPRPWTNDGHPFGMLYPAPGAPVPTGTWDADVALTMFPGDGFGCSFWMRAPARVPSPDVLMGARIDGGPLSASTSAANQYAVLVAVIDGAPYAILSTPTSTQLQATYPSDWRQPREPTWFHIGMHWAFGAGSCTMTVAVNGRTYNGSTVPCNIGAPRMQPWAPTTTMFYQSIVPMTNVCWFRSPTAPQTGGWVGASWTSQADIDPGLNELTGIPQLAGEDPLSLLGEIASAEAASFGWGVDGRPYFRSRAVSRPPMEPAPITADRDLAELAISTSEETVRNSISAATTPLLVADYEFVVDAKEVDQFRCGPGGSSFTVALPPDTVAVDPLRVGQFNQAGYLNAWDDVSDRPDYRDVWMYCAVYVDNLTAPVDPSLLSMRLFATIGGQLTFTVFNFSGRSIQFQTEDVVKVTQNSDGTYSSQTTKGKAAFRIPGRLLKPQATVPQLIEDPGSVTTFGPRGYDLGGGSGGGGNGSRWLQHPKATQGVAESILASTAYPQPVLDTVTALHDPRRELYDTVEIVDPSGMGSVVGTLTGITTHHSIGQACEDDLVLRPLAPPGFGVEGRDGVGTTLRFGA